MAEDLNALWNSATPIKQGEDLNALWAGAKPIQPAAAQPQDEGVMTAIGRGLKQGVTLGLGDEAYGAQNALVEAFNPTDPAMKDKGLFDRLATIPGAYQQYRDLDRASNAASQQQHPFAYGAGQVGGSIPTIVATGGAGSLGAAATTGAVAGFGAGEGGAVDQARSTAQGAIFGAAGQAGGQLLSPAGAAVGQQLERGAASLAARSSGATGSEAAKDTLSYMQKPLLDKLTSANTWDALAAGAGALAGGLPGAGTALVASRVVQNFAPALRDMSLSAAQKIMGRFAPYAQRSVEQGIPVAAVNNVLNQTSAEYRQAQKKINDTASNAERDQ